MDNGSTQDERMMTLVATALTLNGLQREEYLRAACGSDQPLLEETLEAIEWEERMGAFLRHPMVPPPNNADHLFEPGQTVSQRFQIIRRIGEGGMGVVYEAVDLKRNQRIALKCAKPGFGRLLTPELESCLKVRHPNVCLVNEIHTSQTSSGDVDFLTMELLEGEPLSALLSRHGKLPPEEAEEIARQLCAGLAAAHRSNVIHRDFKAANIIVCRPDAANQALRAVITDFGLAGEAAKTGFFGTQRYLAPELLLGQQASKASDIYALGVVLYEMSNGTKQQETATPKVSRDYQRLTSHFLSLQPDRRTRAFEGALQTLAQPTYLRRHWLTVGVGAALTLSGVTWSKRESIANALHPLPQKRFVAIMPWPSSQDQQSKSVISAAIDAMESELSRAESVDRDFFVISARDPSHASLAKLGQSLGVNLALQVSGDSQPGGIQLLLKLLDVSTGAILRHHQILCRPNEIAGLSLQAVQSAASLLNISWDEQSADRVTPSTSSAIALQAFLDAEELRKKANDDGLQAAIESYKKAIDADPRYAAAYAKLAWAYIRLNAITPDSGVLELSRANAEKALQLNPRLATAHVALAFFFAAKGILEEAIAQMRSAMEFDPTNPKNFTWQGQIYRLFNRWQEAEVAFRRAQKERPNYYVPYDELGVTLGNVGRYQEAVGSLKAASALVPNSTTVLNDLGLFTLKLGNVQLAEQIYRRSLAIKPSAFASFNLAEDLRCQGKLTEALFFAKRATELAPEDDQSWFALANIYETIGGHVKDARNAFQKASAQAEEQLTTKPNDSSILMRLALYRIKAGSPQDALHLIQQAKSSAPLALDSQILQVRILELAAKRKDALDVVASCFKSGPVAFELEQTKDLQSLLRDPRYAAVPKPLVARNSNTLLAKGVL